MDEWAHAASEWIGGLMMGGGEASASASPASCGDEQPAEAIGEEGAEEAGRETREAAPPFSLPRAGSRSVLDDPAAAATHAASLDGWAPSEMIECVRAQRAVVQRF